MPCPEASAAASPAGSASASASASAAAGASASAAASGGATGASGDAILSGWQSSPAEGNALTQTLLSFQSAHPEVKVDYQPLGGDYAAGMAGKFASGDVPDVFYVDAGYANQWIDQGYLAPLDDYISQTNFDTVVQIFTGTEVNALSNQTTNDDACDDNGTDGHSIRRDTVPCGAF